MLNWSARLYCMTVRHAAAIAVARLEPLGLVILIVLIILPMLGAQLGVNLNFISGALAIAIRTIINAILYITGNI
jgi:hypothetical protein